MTPVLTVIGILGSRKGTVWGDGTRLREQDPSPARPVPFVPHHRGRGLHGVEDLLIAGAAADVAGERFTNLVTRRIRVAFEE